MENYIVWSPERGLPSKTHAGIDAATAEAARLAAKHPSVPFHVYGLIKTASASVKIDFLPACAEQSPTPERLAADEAAKGHNPLGLTNAEVGVSEGWRLLEVDELWERAHRDGDGVECRVEQRGEWHRYFGDVCLHARWTFRTKNQPGFYLPAPKIDDHVPPGLPAGSSAGEGFRFLRPDEIVRAYDGANALCNFQSENGFGGWAAAERCFESAVGKAASSDTGRVYRRKTGT